MSCIILLLTSVSSDAAPEVPELDQLVGPPSIQQDKNGGHFALFDYGGLYFKYEISQLPVPFPQCDAVRKMEKEVAIIGSNPKGYIFFVKPHPTAFKTDHGTLWNEIMKRTGNYE